MRADHPQAKYSRHCFQLVYATSPFFFTQSRDPKIGCLPYQSGTAQSSIYDKIQSYSPVKGQSPSSRLYWEKSSMICLLSSCVITEEVNEMGVLPRQTAKDAIHVIPRLDWQSHLGIIFFASYYLTLVNCRSTPRSQWIVRLDGSFF
jgi:hypothetical protein